MDQMNPTKQIANPLAAVVATQGAKLESFTTGVDSAFNVVQEEINELRQSSLGTVAAINKLSEQLIALTTAITTNATVPASPIPVPPVPPVNDASLTPLPGDVFREPNLPCPKVYEGDLALCCGFITQCELIFRHNRSRFYSDDARIAFIVSLLSPL